MNKTVKVNPPNKAPKVILLSVACLFRIIETDRSNKKSNAKLMKIIRSTYTFPF